MLWHKNHGKFYSPEGTGSEGGGAPGGQGAQGGAAGSQGGGAAGQQQQPTWYTGLDPEALGVANNKGWKLDDPKSAFETAAKAYKSFETLRGIPADELVRVPKANAAADDIKAFRQRLGVPKEAKDYDLSGLKFAGAELEPGFATALRNGLLEAGVTKDNAAAAIKPVLKWLEDSDAEENAVLTAKVTKEKEDLDRSWGANKDKNEFIAKSYLSKLAKAAGLTDEEALAGWNAISKAPGSTIGAAAAYKLLLAGGIATGEDRYVGGGGGQENMPLSREGALARIDALKKDTEWQARYLKGGIKETQELHGLHVIAYAPSRAA
jgi:hypothetical protein